MKLLLAAAVVVLAAFQVQAQEAPGERERIKSERAAADRRFVEGQRECRGRFAVNDCLAEVRRQHMLVLGDLKRQENVLKDADRRRRSAERQQAVDERSSPEQQQKAEQRRLKALQDQQEREQRAADKAGKRAADEAARAQKAPRPPKEAKAGPPQPQGTARVPHAPKPSGPTPQEAEKNRRAYEQRIKEAEQHKEEVRLRVAKRSKPAASALPVPAR